MGSSTARAAANRGRAPAPRKAAATSASTNGQRPASQDRGQRRIDSILDAAEEAIAELGYDAATTDAIAKRAGASMGSVYHFFPNKDAILGALATRYAERMSAINAHAMPIELVWLPTDVLFERIVEGQLQFSLTSPSFQPIHDAAMRVFGRTGPYERLETAIMAQVRAYLAARLPRMPEREREAAARLSVTTVHSVLELACRVPESERSLIASELKRMMVRYFAPLDERYGVQRRA